MLFGLSTLGYPFDVYLLDLLKVDLNLQKVDFNLPNTNKCLNKDSKD